ncbi:protein phsophatase-2A [Tritrichomonas foetus]|uniref:Protein phsophatase-2A n=1 Tax=Tritrichomonas foetus TaxID=1144522 RepID=A0A1J4K0B0_9EUKA|nr:protein phsophatase-2A [Tritrichomonas foetus]|eukprot:OHT03174.1 protein phsophatase-2A [Tritrichomonas foetus]
MNKLYGFQDECVEKYGIALYKHIESVFEALPLGYIINKQLFVVHGGLFQDQTITIPALQKLNRFQETPMNGPMHDILWSDPMDTEGFESSGRCDNGQTKNFGTDVTEKFLRENGLRLLIRSHQVQNDGFSITQNGKCITVFSAPNYMGKVGNLGALLKISFDESGQMGDVEFVKFDSVQPFGSTSNQTKKGEEIDTNQPNEENI